MDFNRIADKIILAFDGWEPPSQERGSWRKEMPDGTYEYRYTKPSNSEMTEDAPVFGGKAHLDLKVRESEIYADDIEHLVVYNDAGEKAADIAGENDNVSLVGIMDKFDGAWVTHNHPGGTSFSWPDIYHMFRLKAKGMRITSKKYDYQILFNPDQTTLNLEEVYLKVNAHTRKIFWEKIEKKELSIEEANAIHGHVVWTLAAKELGFKYERTEHK